MKKILLFLLFSTFAFAQTANVQKSIPTNRITAGFKVPSGQTIQFESGSTFQIDTGAITSLLVDPTTTPGDTIFKNASSVLDRLPIGANGKGYVVSGGLPSWGDLAPLSAPYITLQSNSTLTGEFSLGSLTTGLLLNTVSGSVATISKAAAGTDYVGPGAITTSGLTMATARLIGRSTASTGAPEEITVSTGLLLSSGVLTATGLSNPMTTAGDLIVGGASGTPTRFPGSGTDAWVLTYDSAQTLKMKWAAAGGGGSGDLVGPGSATDNAITRFDSTTGKLVQNSLVIVDDSGNISTGGTLPGSTSLYIERSGLAIAQLLSTGNDARLRLNRPDLTKGAIVEFIRGTTDEWLFGTPFSGASPTGNEFTIDFYDGTTEHNWLLLNTAGALKLGAYGAGALTTDASGNVTATSDERLKNIQGRFGRGLGALANIHPILYRWNEKSRNETQTTYAGFSAQNVQASIPEAVGKMADGYLTLQDRALLAAVVNADHELYFLVKALFGLFAVLLVAIIWTRKK